VNSRGDPNWSSRWQACPRCGHVRKSHRPSCRVCNQEPTTVRCACGNTFTPWVNDNGKGRDHAATTCGRCVKKPKVKAERERKPSVIVQCAWCGLAFEKTNNRRFCSVPCRKRGACARHHLRRRGLRKRQPYVSLPIIFRRDRGRCGLCGERVLLQFKPPDSRAATIDHIVPIKWGGQHNYDNVQLAHYGCNSSKCDRATGNQLRLRLETTDAQ
jgi:hypothetical protein